MIPRLRIWWNTLNARERRMIVLGGLGSLLLIVVFADVEPVWKLRARLEGDIPKLQVQLLEMKALATEAAQLGKALPATSGQDLRQSLERSLAASGMRAQRIESQTPGEWFVSLTAVDAAAALAWIESASREARLFVRTTKIQRTAAGVDVELRFVQAGQTQ